MANTIMSAKNSFQDGLLLDFSPENSKATSMTAALNATLVTFNGNEMSLQNDMGNGRVETAFLPEGYIPVGSCEFGDIIYIVSYNPLINKSQIGCFPSPERNISSEELGGLQQSLSWKDFQEGNDTTGPTGGLKASSVKKILYDNRDMTPGDKYIIYSEDLGSSDNNKYLSDYNNPTHEHGTFPKLAKIHVVSIEESGKIVYLDSTTKWYDKNNYYLNADLSASGGIQDLDGYRTMVSSAYSVFSSKVSGKLAILVELEKITGFSCSWEPYIDSSDSLDSEGLKYTNYSIYWNFNWTTDDYNINPNGAILTLSEWTGVDKNREGQYQTWTYNGKYEIDLQESSAWKSVTCPSSYETIISRNYRPEIHSIVPYSTFLSTYEYNNYQQRIINSIKQGDVEPYKLNIQKQEGQPYVGRYYVNCTSIIEDVPKTTDSTGKLVNAWNGPLNDDIVNNYFHYPVVKKFANFNIPTKQIFKEGDTLVSKTPYINNLIYHYKIAPTMPYGILDEYTQEGYIDFSKIGTKSIALNTWKYYNYENTSTLTWGMEAYTEPGKGISEVVFEFYDNQRFVAAYLNKGKRSYNGTFTEYITLNESGSNYKLNNIKAFPDYDLINGKPIPKPTYHKGLEVLGSNTVAGVTYLDGNGNKVNPQNINSNTTYYQDDSGTLYSNFLYLVKIIIKYCNKGILDEYIEPSGENDSEHVLIDYRWFWTNTMFNEYYYNAQDFKDLQFILNLDGVANIGTTNNYEIKNYKYNPSFDDTVAISSNNSYKSLSANVQTVNIDGKQNDNIKLSISPGLYNNYNTFNLSEDHVGNLDVIIYLAKDYLSNSSPQPKVIYSEEDLLMDTTYLNPVMDDNPDGKLDTSTSNTLNTLVGASQGSGKEIYEDATSYMNYKNEFLLTSTESSSTKTGNTKDKTLAYLASDGSDSTITDFQQYNRKLSQLLHNESFTNYFKLTLSGIHYSKYLFLTKALQNVKMLRSFVLNTDDLIDYNLFNNNGYIHFSHMLMTSNTDESGHNCHQHIAIVDFKRLSSSSYSKSGVQQLETFNLGDDGNIDVHKALDLNYDKISEQFKFLFPFGYGHDGRNASPARKDNNNPIISNNKDFNKTTNYYSLDLGGTLAGITDSAIEPADQHVSQNALEYFAPAVLGYLTQLFYLTDSDQTLQMPHNYVYLEPNYCSYKKDVVIQLLSNNVSNNLILIQGIKYQDYLNKVTDRFSNKAELLASPNVTLQLESCLKTQPIEFIFNYITPTADVFVNNSIAVASIFNDIPRVINQGLQSDKIYGWDPDIQSFKTLGSVDKLKKISSYNISGSQITSSLSENTSNMYLRDINKYRLLEIDGNNKLRLTKIPSVTKEYSVNTHSTKSGEGRNRSLTGYKVFKYYYDY